MKPRIIITGVSGRIGTQAAALFSRDYEVIGLDLSPYEGKSPITYIRVDLSSDISVAEAFDQIPKGPIASVLHLAAYYNFAGGHWDLYEKITLRGTKRILEALREYQVEQFVFSSSLLVYASCKKGEKITEEWPLNPKWEYPLSKVQTEDMLMEMRGNMPLCILRIAGIYDDYCHSIPISQQILRIYHKELESHFYPGRLDHGQPFLHMDDLIRACNHVIEKRKILAPVSIYNIGEDVTYSYQQIQKELGLVIHGKPWKTYHIPKWVAKGGTWAREHLPFLKKSFIKPWMIDLTDDHQEISISKAKADLGWEPKFQMFGTLSLMVGALNRDPSSWIQSHQLH